MKNTKKMNIILVNISVASYASNYKLPIVKHHEKKVTKGCNYYDYFNFLKLENKLSVKFYCIEILSYHGFTKQINN